MEIKVTYMLKHAGPNATPHNQTWNVTSLQEARELIVRIREEQKAKSKWYQFYKDGVRIFQFPLNLQLDLV